MTACSGSRCRGPASDAPIRTRGAPALAQARGWNRIAVVGVSSGAPYALACAAELPELVAAVAIAAGLSSQCAPHRAPGLPWPTRAFLATLVAAPSLCIGLLGGAARLLRRTERLVARLAGEGRAEAVRALTAAVQHGVRGPVEDFLLCARPWEIDPATITTEVHLWHGLRDRIAPPEHAWQLAAGLPRCSVWVAADETHFLFRRCSAEIAGELVAAARAAEVPVPAVEPSSQPGRPARRGELGGRADRVLPRSSAEAPWVCRTGGSGGQACLDEVDVQPVLAARSWRSRT